MALSDTIFALSSGTPPAAIAVVRISGVQAGLILRQLAGALPPPRRATLASLRGAHGALLDRALILWFPGPATATGEDLAELHLHGGRAVIGAVEATLAAAPGLRRAAPGEFTRRAFEHGRIDLAEAEGLADLLSAETESQRRHAISAAGGEVSRLVIGWSERLLALGAQIEAALDFADEDDVPEVDSSLAAAAVSLRAEIDAYLLRPAVDRLRDGVRVVLAGPPNSGKSTLFNALVGREAAITSPIAGTTRDVIEAPVAIGGTPFLLLDTAGLRDSEDAIEGIGVARAVAAVSAADLVLWLGPGAAGPDGSIRVRSRADARTDTDTNCDISVSALTGEGMDALARLLTARASALLPAEGETAFNARQREELRAAAAALAMTEGQADLLLLAESLRLARAALDRITGRAGIEQMLDGLFGRFCIGK